MLIVHVGLWACEPSLCLLHSSALIPELTGPERQP